jgi:hypothetical protein
MIKTETDRTSRRTFLGVTAGGLLASQACTSTRSERFPWRVIELWHTPDNKVVFWTRHGNIVNWADMLHTQPTSPLGRYIAQLSQWGFNGMTLAWDTDPDQNPEAMRNFTDYLKDHGLRFVLSRTWAEFRRASGEKVNILDGGPGYSEKLCPYQADVRAYWTKRIDRDFQMMPALGAIRISAFARNGPWMCNCSECQKRPPRQRTLDAIQFMGGLLAKHGSTLIWEACQDDPWLARIEAEHYSDLTGKVPANVLVLLKDHYWDFHPGWPPHPAFHTIRKDAQGKSPYATNIQTPGEYRGLHEFPWHLVDEFSQTFRGMADTGQQAAWVTTEVLPDGWDHPLNMVNWHAIATYMRDPYADPAKIKLEWAQKQFGAKAAPAVVEVVEKVTEAARGMYEFDALWTQKHSRFPWLEYLDCHVCGPYREMKRVKGMMGMELPLDMFPPDQAAKIKANPKTRMVFNRVPVTPQLKAEAMAQRNNAVQSMEQAIKQWDGLKGAIPAAEHARIAAGLAGNRDDTIIFRNMMDIYMDWKLGVLTEKRIDAVLAESRGLKGIIVAEPMAAASSENAITSGTMDRVQPTLAGFAEELRRDLRKPWVEDFWKKHPTGVQ